METLIPSVLSPQVRCSNPILTLNDTILSDYGDRRFWATCAYTAVANKVICQSGMLWLRHTRVGNFDLLLNVVEEVGLQGLVVMFPTGSFENPVEMAIDKAGDVLLLFGGIVSLFRSQELCSLLTRAIALCISNHLMASLQALWARISRPLIMCASMLMETFC